jgi:hypothetical protein
MKFGRVDHSFETVIIGGPLTADVKNWSSFSVVATMKRKQTNSRSYSWFARSWPLKKI